MRPECALQGPSCRAMAWHSRVWLVPCPMPCHAPCPAMPLSHATPPPPPGLTVHAAQRQHGAARVHGGVGDAACRGARGASRRVLVRGQAMVGCLLDFRHSPPPAACAPPPPFPPHAQAPPGHPPGSGRFFRHSLAAASSARYWQGSTSPASPAAAGASEVALAAAAAPAASAHAAACACAASGATAAQGGAGQGAASRREEADSALPRAGGTAAPAPAGLPSAAGDGGAAQPMAAAAKGPRGEPSLSSDPTRSISALQVLQGGRGGLGQRRWQTGPSRAGRGQALPAPASPCQQPERPPTACWRAGARPGGCPAACSAAGRRWGTGGPPLALGWGAGVGEEGGRVGGAWERAAEGQLVAGMIQGGKSAIFTARLPRIIAASLGGRRGAGDGCKVGPGAGRPRPVHPLPLRTGSRRYRPTGAEAAHERWRAHSARSHVASIRGSCTRTASWQRGKGKA